jgi:hypothetical protein
MLNTTEMDKRAAAICVKQFSESSDGAASPGLQDSAVSFTTAVFE